MQTQKKKLHGVMSDQVAPVVNDLVSLLDQRLRNQFEGLYLVGSVAFDDFCPGQSDIDFIAIVSKATDCSPLPSIHAEIARRHRGVHCDGIYLTRCELSRPPDGRGPVARAGKVTMSAPDERHPVTWLTLLSHGLTVRGSEPSSSWIAADFDAAIEYSRQNLLSYWLPWIDRRRRLVGFGGPSLLTKWAVVWGALGVARLYTAITTG